MKPWKERGIAGVLFCMTALLLLSQLDMGYSRDESFYFRYARSYAGWFADLEATKTVEEARGVLGREDVLETWTGNFEHPPLMKTAFGASWRHLGRKYRPLTVPRGAGESRVTGLSPADGFAEDAEVLVLAPVAVGGDVQGERQTLA
ncbi:MAG: hypothetical protein VX938_12155, partial [Myxococcota bacterium]|nr:hypothetical protein [Myxococcota bacterium]